MSISTEDRERVSNAIRAAEAKTSGEIVCVLAEASTDTTALPVLIAAVAALGLPWLLVAFTTMTVHQILLLQIALFFALLLILCSPHVRVALIPRKARRAMAYRVAMEQFTARGLARRTGPSGILIFASLAEHYARIIANDRIAALVPQSAWQAAVDALVAHAREGRIANGFVAAIDLCGLELARHFPRTEATRNELPDRIYLI
jgi:putative membrane protein